MKILLGNSLAIGVIMIVLIAYAAAPQLQQGTSLAFSTYFGGSLQDSVRDVTTDSSGNVYIAGGTASSNFPTTAGAYDRTFNGTHDVYVAKFDPSGNLIWSTVIGGPNYDRAYAIEVDSQGYVYIAGRAGPGFPTTPGVVQPNFGGDVSPNTAYGQQDGFITKLSPDGSRIIWSTYFGGDDGSIIRDMAIDNSGNVYVVLLDVTRSNPHITAGAFQTALQGSKDNIVAKISSDGSRVVWASYLGGSLDEIGGSIRVDSNGYVYVTTGTLSSDILTTTGAYNRTLNGPQDVYVAKLMPNGSALIYGTYLGGSQDDYPAGTHALAVDSQGNAYVAGETYSSNYPTTLGAFQGTFGGGTHDVFVSKLSPDGSQLLASTFLGGSGEEGNEGTVVDSGGNVYISGRTTSNNFPLTADAYQSVNKQGGSGFDAGDGFFVKLSSDLSQLLYSTFIGGSAGDAGRACAIDSNGNFYLGGWTQSNDWPTLNAFQTSRSGDWDGVLARFSPQPPKDTTPPAPPTGLGVK